MERIFLKDKEMNMVKTTPKQKIILVIFGIFLFFILLEVILRFGGLAYLSLQEYRNRESLKRSGPNQYRILCLGESTTAFGGEDSYPVLLESILNQKLPSMKFSVINRGIPGVDTFVILSELGYNIRRYNPDMIITMIGANDDSVSFPHNDVTSKIKNIIKPLRVYKVAALLLARLKSKDSLKNVYFIEGISRLEYRHYLEAQRMFKKVIDLAPKEPLAYVSLSQCYYEQGMNDKAWELIKKAEELAVNHPEVYIDLGWRYYDMGFPLLAEEAFKKAIKFNPFKPNGYYDLAQFYQGIRKYPEAEAMFRKVVELDPNDNYNSYMDFGLHYFERGMFTEAADMLMKAIKINNVDPMPYWYLGFIKEAQGKHEEALLYFNQIKYDLDFVNKVTKHNYNKLKDIILKKNIKLVCVQYPMRKLDSLRQLFKKSDGIVFVDNESIFKKAVNSGGYDDYFVDKFGGDFGHCTRRGNLLLANNIEETIVREYFSKNQ